MRDIKDLKLKKLADLREMEEKALKKELNESSKSLFELRMKGYTGEQKQTHLISFLRKYIAQIKTVANEKGINLA